MKVLKTKKDFINFFDKLPANRWTEGAFSFYQDGKTKHCAVGFIREQFLDNEEGESTYNQVKKNFRAAYNVDINVLMDVNDDAHKKYNSKKLKLKESNVKGRVLAYLKKK